MKVASLLYKTNTFIKEKNDENLSYEKAQLVSRVWI